MLLSVAAGGDVDVVDVWDVDPVDVEPDGAAVDVVLLDIESGGLVALAAAFEAPVVLESLHPASRPEASSKEQTINSLAPITRPS
jgi:hypothetical protein